MKRTVMPQGLADSRPNGYSQGVRVGDWLFVAGQLGNDHDYRIVSPNDFEMQTRRVFSNIETVLVAEGGSLRDLVTMTVFLVDMTKSRQFLALRAEVLQKDFPASALIGVSALANPAALVEIQAIAYLGSGRPSGRA